VKDTSLVAQITVAELFLAAQRIAAFSSEFLVVYIEAAVIYWLFCLVLSFGQDRIERRLDRRVAH
jgi:cystine transport system permease protein